MLVNFSVENFGPIRDKQTLSFEAQKDIHLEDEYVIHCENGMRLLKFAIIFGANASGKSTLIEALQFLYKLILCPLEKKNENLLFLPFEFDSASKDKNSSLSIEFLQNGTRYYYFVSFDRTHIVLEELFVLSKKKTKTNVFRRTTDTDKQVSSLKFGRSFNVPKAAVGMLSMNTLWNTTVLSSFMKVNVDQKELKDATEWVTNHLIWVNSPYDEDQTLVTDFIDNGIIDKSKVLQVLQKADFNIDDILYKKKEGNQNDDKKEFDLAMVHSVKSEKYYLPYAFESDGTKRFYMLAGFLEMARKVPHLIAVDEIDASLHPDLVLHYLLMFMENVKNSQLIVTTHCREILDDKNLFRNDAVWFTNKKEDGATELYSLDDFDTSVIRDTSNILNAYKSGKLNAIPKTKDYFL